MNNYTVFDAHCDTLCRLCDNGGNVRKNTYNLDINRMAEYEGYTQAFACFIAPEYYGDAMARFRALCDTYKAQDFSGIRPMLTLEGGEVIASLSDIDYLKECGVRAVALTWNNTNRLASGVGAAEGSIGGTAPDVITATPVCCDGVAAEGLTEFGKCAVRRLEELGILIDVSHLSDKSFYDVARIATKPLIATHSNSRAICPHPRNLTDEMFNIIKDSGGVAGINLYPLFLTGNDTATSKDAMRHIEHFLALGGIDAIGIGADFDGTDDSLPTDIQGCEGLVRLFDLMAESGMAREEIDKISHKNFLRVFKEEG